MRLSTACAAALLLAAACDTGRHGGATSDADAQCRVVQRGYTLPDGLSESSGLAASRRTAGVYWTHDDSGNGPIVYAITNDGRLAGRVHVAGAHNKDWEEIASGPCPAGSCLYVGDIGNNREDRDPVIWRIPEPDLRDTLSEPAEKFIARYPKGRPDAEAMFMLPDGSVYIITKGIRHPIRLYRWPTPLDTASIPTMQLVRELAPRPSQTGDRVTGASASPDGRWVAVRTYATIAFYRTADLLGSGAPAAQMDLTPLSEPQGEALSLANDGSVVLTSEGPGKHIPGTVSRLSCALPR